MVYTLGGPNCTDGEGEPNVMEINGIAKPYFTGGPFFVTGLVQWLVNKKLCFSTGIY